MNTNNAEFGMRDRWLKLALEGLQPGVRVVKYAVKATSGGDRE
jgi:hypothetical protein